MPVPSGLFSGAGGSPSPWTRITCPSLIPLGIWTSSVLGRETRPAPRQSAHFSITILLSYVKDKVRYTKLKAFVEAHIIDKLEYMKAHCPNDAETLIMLLDLVVCPYISAATKNTIGLIFSLDAAALAWSPADDADLRTPLTPGTRTKRRSRR